MIPRHTCLSSEELTLAAFDRGADPRLVAHAMHCAVCAEKLRDIESLINLGRALPDGAPTPDRADAVWSRILASENTAGRSSRAGRRPIWAAAAAFVLILTGIALAYWRLGGRPAAEAPEVPKTYRGWVDPRIGSVYSVVNAQPDEIIRFREGSLTVKVEKLGAKERFRVIVGDGEVEVRGTVFDVDAAGDRLVSVRVMNGEVVVRPDGRPTVVLHAGEAWSATEASPPPLESKDAREMISQSEAPKRNETEKHRAVTSKHPRPEAAVRGDVESPTPAVSLSEQAFNEGWRQFKRGQFSEAISSFENSYAADPRSGFAEDSLFWKAVAEDRRGQARASAATLERFLNTYPRSLRSGEASAMLGWKVLRAGDSGRATQLFKRAENDASKRVRENAAAGLKAVEAASH